MTVDVFSSAPTLTNRATDGREVVGPRQSQLQERRPRRIEQKKTDETGTSRAKRRTGTDTGAGSASMSASATVHGVRPTPDKKRLRIA